MYSLKCIEPSKDHARWQPVQEEGRVWSDLYEDDPEWFLIYLQWREQGKNSRRSALGFTSKHPACYLLEFILYDKVCWQALFFFQYCTLGSAPEWNSHSDGYSIFPY